MVAFALTAVARAQRYEEFCATSGTYWAMASRRTEWAKKIEPS
jgi:hypothetical protein